MIGNDNITLEYKLTPGEVLRYRSVVSSKQIIQEGEQLPEELESSLEIVMVQSVKEVSNGIAKVEVVIESGSVHRGQEELPLDTVGQKLLLSMKRNGDIISTSVNMPFSQPAFPSNALRPGDSWFTTNPMNIPAGSDGQTKNIDLKYQHTLARFDHVRSHDVAIIDVKCPSVDIELSEDIHQIITAEGSTKFAHIQGRLIESNVHTHTEVIAPDTSITTDINVSVELLGAGSDDVDSTNSGIADEVFIIS